MSKRKLFLTLLTLVLFSTVSAMPITEDKITKEVATHKTFKNKQLIQHQIKVNKIRETEEGKEIFRLVDYYSKKYNVDSRLIHAVILAESGYMPNAKSNANARGLMQLTSVHIGKVEGCYNLYNKRCNIETGVKHLSGLLSKYKGNEHLALASYNAGGGAVDRSLKKTGTIPSYTKNYVYKVQNFKQLF